MRDSRKDPREGDVLYTPVGQLLVVEAVYPNYVKFTQDGDLRISPLELWRLQSMRDTLLEETAEA